MMTLAACATSGSRVAASVTLPPMPQSTASPCKDPGVKSGAPVLTEFAKNRLALAECKRKHANAVKFYDDIRRRVK